ncbi:MAG: glycosyltransferase family 39 protein [Sulfurimonas sp.]|uniref:glycosyltransferase family 39 protein n=1 Tax=Sulfurimonas sp. TaxID=2022749 RepID=UPI00261DBDA6|nr:glycosyltransferase family 39 protein [Sulfurimonas sp.]MDD2652287.1 glycosyltransferase family 39 protein [Sulfurimonas sp.]MDD3451544.1 glycosyltransferase family 39 protein [Sulfurimonas sp.]
MIERYRRELSILAGIFAFKILILWLLPLTGDEAYFIKWAHNPSMGYYDHPPMVGWVLYAMSFVSDSHLFFRSFAILATFVAAFVLYKIALLYGIHKEKALYTSFLFLVSPVDLLLVLMTNDVALLFFSSLGTLFLLYSLEKKEWFGYALLAGVFLGAAFLSKYFAVFMLFSLLLFSILTYKTKALKTVAVVAFIVLLFISQNLYFNYNSCWNNILFNFFARTEDSVYGISTVLAYFGLLLYVVTPWGLYFLLKSKFEKTTLLRLLTLILSVAFFIFFVVSLKNNIGLHWFLLFIPYIFLLFSFIQMERLQKLFNYNAIFTSIHIIIIVTALLLPTSLFKEHKKYSDIVMYTKPQAICEELKEFNDERIFTLGYSSASLLSHFCKREFNVLFNNSKYGRLDDKLLDVRELANSDITLFHKSPIDEKLLTQSCNSFSLDSFNGNGAIFYTATCKGFNYEFYKKNYLDVQNEKFYNIPSWLPVGACYFKERYYR